jgi:hypothetical protein
VEFGEWKGGIFSRYLATLGRTGGSGFNSCDLGVFLLGVLVTERGKRSDDVFPNYCWVRVAVLEVFVCEVFLGFLVAQ